MPGDALIRVIAGPGSGRQLDLEVGASASIGRDPACDLVIPDDAISREHVKLENRPDGLMVTSVGKNPAVLDRRKLPKTAVLVPFRTQLSIGATKLEISFEQPPQPPEGLTLERRLGRGETGSVYTGRLRGVKGPVAVKVVAPGTDRQLLARVRREAELQRRLDHAAIVRVHALLEHGGKIFLVRELVLGVSLDDQLAGGPLPWPRAAALGETLAAALAHAHEHGVVHRDVSPANIFLDEKTGAARLSDFGFAREVGQRGTIDGTFVTKTCDSFGTFHYVAPEQIGGAKDAGPPADVYGLGAVLYHALSGARPFADVRMDDFVRAVYRGVTPLGEVTPSVPPPIARLVMEAMNPILEVRPTAGALAASLGALVAR